MDCPKCKDEMVEGKIQTQHVIHFHTLDRRIYFPTKKNATLIGESIWSSPLLHSYHCSNCEIVVVDYKNKIANQNDHKQDQTKQKKEPEELDPFEEYYQKK